MLQEAIKEYDLLRNKRPIVEGTSGSTGIALAYICKALQLPLHVVLPDDQAEEKKALLERLGASVTIVPTCAISNKDHYVNTARRMAKDLNGVFMDQFDNLANYKAHHEQTGTESLSTTYSFTLTHSLIGPEIWNQCHGNIDCFVMSAGTGGTIAGVSNYLKNKSKKIQIILADPTGSSLLSKVKYNVCYTAQQSERKIKKHRYDSIVEGVGLDRITKNFNLAVIDDAYSVTDQEVLDTVLTRSWNYSLIHSLTVTLTHSLLLTYSLLHSRTHSLIVTLTHLLTHCYTQYYTCSLIDSRTCSLIDSRTNSLRLMYYYSGKVYSLVLRRL
jgi:cysteine synthase